MLIKAYFFICTFFAPDLTFQCFFSIVRSQDYFTLLIYMAWNPVGEPIGMISHKISLITIFGHKYFRLKFHQKFEIFHKKFKQLLILVHICYEIANFEAKILQKF